MQRLLRGSLKSAPKPSYPFALSCQKLILSYCEVWQSATGMREYLKYEAVKLAQQHPSVEIVVKKVPYRHPHVTANYSTGRDKSICVRNLKPHEIKEKVALALDSAGRKLKNLDGYPVESITPSVRGIHSPFHSDRAPLPLSTRSSP